MAAKVTLPALLKAMVDQGSSDLHLSAGAPPEFRISGRMVRVKMDPLTPPDIQEMCYAILTADQKAAFEAENELDFSFPIPGLARFRGNLFVSKGGVSAVFRLIPSRIPSFEELKLPLVLKKVMKRPHGLILVTGPTGSGKSTSLAAMLDFLNQEEFGHIITLEDPIEFVHTHKNCVVNQREVGSDTESFLAALRRILRQDPDYILVGELRDRETMEMALTMAETGHLVFGTLHTNGAIQSINRIVNSFEPHNQVQIRQVLAQNLQAVYSQQLVAKRNGPGRALVAELMIPNIAIRNNIREDKIHLIYSAMQTGQEDSGMFTMNQSLVNYVRDGTLAKADALEMSPVPEEIVKLLGSVSDRK